ncbi:hypothetical protein [uncultured Brachyspira sp.]|uniref:hypothetical protein n=1 Tax=uncultured Brachyspira sp. TaxID=221953 RepID=UPI0025E368A3|nr:hypothetical protein [uncultured Brachyspira sp.]
MYSKILIVLFLIICIISCGNKSTSVAKGFNLDDLAGIYYCTDKQFANDYFEVDKKGNMNIIY